MLSSIACLQVYGMVCLLAMRESYHFYPLYLGPQRLYDYYSVYVYSFHCRINVLVEA